MKKLVLFLSVAIGISVAHAQNAKFTGTMKKFISTVDTAKTGEDFQNAANNFERVANAEKTEWLPNYYAAFSLVMKAYTEKDTKNIDPLLDKADAFLSAAETLTKNNSEITALKAMSVSARISVDFMRGMSLGPKSSQLAKLAQAQDSLNPRAYMQEAQMLYHTPEPFGGSKVKGKEMMKKALDLFATFKPQNELYPNWGKEFAQKTYDSWK